MDTCGRWKAPGALASATSALAECAPRGVCRRGCPERDLPRWVRWPHAAHRAQGCLRGHWSWGPGGSHPGGLKGPKPVADTQSYGPLPAPVGRQWTPPRCRRAPSPPPRRVHRCPGPEQTRWPRSGVSARGTGEKAQSRREAERPQSARAATDTRTKGGASGGRERPGGTEEGAQSGSEEGEYGEADFTVSLPRLQRAWT